MSEKLSIPAERSSLRELTAHAIRQARIALPILEGDFADWLHWQARQQAQDVAEAIRRRTFLRLSVLEALHDIELLLDEEISGRIVTWTATAEHDCDMSNRVWTETYWPPEAQALWAIRHELNVLRDAIGAVLTEIETEELLRTGRRTRDGLVPSVP